MSAKNRFTSSLSPPSSGKDMGSLKSKSLISGGSSSTIQRSRSASFNKQRNHVEVTMNKADSMVTVYHNAPIRITYLPPDNEIKSTSLLFEANNNSKFVVWKRIPIPGDSKYNFSVSTAEIQYFNKDQKQFLLTPIVAIFGGRDSTPKTAPEKEKPISNLILFNISSGVCSSVTFLTNEPSFRYGHAMISNQQKLYIFGGFNGKTANNELLIINIFYNKCTCATIKENQILSDSWPSARSCHTLTKIESQNDKDDKKNKTEKFKAYMFGGIEDSGKLSGELWELTCFKGASPRWRLLSQTGPPPRYGHIAYMQNGNFCVAGGYDESGKPLNDIWMFELGKRNEEKTKKSKSKQKESKAHTRSNTRAKPIDTKIQFSQSFKGLPLEPTKQADSTSKDDSLIDLSASRSSSSEFFTQHKSNSSKSKSEIPDRSVGKWTQIAVFKPDSSLFACDGNLFIADHETKIIQKLSGLNTLALIDDKFEKMEMVKGDQSQMKERLKKNISDYYEKQQELQKLTTIRNLLTDPNPKLVADGESMAKSYFNPQKIAPLNERITTLRKEFVNQAIELVDRHINVFCIEDKEPGKITEQFIKDQIQQLAFQTEKYLNRRRELETERELSSSLLSNIQNGTPTYQDPAYKASLEYSMKQIEYNSLKQKEANLIDKIKRIRGKINQNETKMVDIFEQVEIADETLKHQTKKRTKWDFKYQDALSQLQKSETMIELIALPDRDAAMKQKIKQLQEKVQQMTDSNNDVFEKTVSPKRLEAIRGIDGILKMLKAIRDIPFAAIKNNLNAFMNTFNSEPIPTAPKREQEQQVLLQLPKNPQFPDSFLQQWQKKQTQNQQKLIQQQKQIQQQSIQRKILVQQQQRKQQTEKGQQSSGIQAMQIAQFAQQQRQPSPAQQTKPLPAQQTPQRKPSPAQQPQKQTTPIQQQQRKPSPAQQPSRPPIQQSPQRKPSPAQQIKPIQQTQNPASSQPLPQRQPSPVIPPPSLFSPPDQSSSAPSSAPSSDSTSSKQHYILVPPQQKPPNNTQQVTPPTQQQGPSKAQQSQGPKQPIQQHYPQNPQRHQSLPPQQHPNFAQQQQKQRINTKPSSPPQQIPPVLNRPQSPNMPVNMQYNNPTFPGNVPPNMQMIPPNLKPIQPGVPPNMKPVPGNLQPIQPNMKPVNPPNMPPNMQPIPMNPQNPNPVFAGRIPPNMQPIPANMPPNMPPMPGNMPPNMQPMPGNMPPNMQPMPGNLPPNMQPIPGNLPPNKQPLPGNYRPATSNFGSYGQPMPPNRPNRLRSTSINSGVPPNVREQFSQNNPLIQSDAGNPNSRPNSAMLNNGAIAQGLRTVPPPAYSGNPNFPSNPPPGARPVNPQNIPPQLRPAPGSNAPRMNLQPIPMNNQQTPPNNYPQDKKPQ